MHLEDEQLQRLLHGELDQSRRAELERHVEWCAPCRQRLSEARTDEEEIFDLLRLTDHAPPSVRAETLISRARPPRRWRRWAAAAALAVIVVGAAYATPGSPLPRWVAQIVERVTRSTPEAPPPAPAPPTETATAGIAVTPTARFTIRFTTSQPVGALTVSLTAGSEIVARVHNGNATFTSEVNRLIVINEGSTADYTIELPRNAPWVEIQVGERRVLLKEGPRVSVSARPDSLDRYVLSLQP